MRRTRRQFVEDLIGAAGGISVMAGSAQAQAKSPTSRKAQPKPQTVMLRGRVVCYTEEFARQHNIEPECDEKRILWGLKTTDARLYSFLPTDQAAAIYDDPRFRQRDLQVTARLFPQTTWLEVIKLQSVRAGRVHDLFYFCEVCNIGTHKPGPCVCCQDPVVFHEEPAEENAVIKP
jgi:hypothetical protein